MRYDFIFAYGSLLNPSSLRATLPDIDVRSCIPARIHGFERNWSLAFPNDGSQRDKSYLDDEGGRPRVVLFVNLQRTIERSPSSAAVTGVLIPVGPTTIERLVRRELRYELIEVSEDVEMYTGFEDEADTGEVRIATFIGRREFTRPEDIESGVISREYRDIVDGGFRYWDGRAEGFAEDSRRTTVASPGAPVLSLTRIDHPPAEAP